jgi:hypothetical protein
VRVLFDDNLPQETLNRVEIDGSGLASGTYFVQVVGRDFTTSRSVTFVR